MGLDVSKAAMQSVGNYDLLEKIAEGGMGAIWKGRHRTTGETVAVKIMPAHMVSNSTLLKRFEQEFRAASRLDHPNVVRALDYGDSDGKPYLVMEFVQGESLGQRIEREGRMPEAEAIRIIAQVAQGLHRAHKQNLVHRDVKPDNILVTPDGTAKLADLGLVKEMETDLNLTKTGRGLGTPHFMAPEQFRNAKSANARCDIYSLGATLYMMVTGELPFGRSNGPLEAWMKKVQNELTPPRQLVPELSERCDWAIRRAMASQADHRPVSCREFVEDLTGHSTRRIPTTDSRASLGEMWYLIYQDEAGDKHTVKGTTPAIRWSLKEGLLGDAANVRASRSKAGPFEMLQERPEFRDLILALPGVAEAVATAPVSPSTPLPVAAPNVPAARTKSTRREDTLPPGAVQRIPRQTGEAPVPHIELNATPAGENWRQYWELLTWLGLIALAAASALAAYYLIPDRLFR
jgi:eukaryotic-like serine/threonine-protein kinase